MNLCQVLDRYILESAFRKSYPPCVFLAWQSLALCDDSDECDSNMHQSLLLCGEDFPSMTKFMMKKQLKYISRQMQNKFLSIMALQVLSKVAVSLDRSLPYCDGG